MVVEHSPLSMVPHEIRIRLHIDFDKCLKLPESNKREDEQGKVRWYSEIYKCIQTKKR